jgi:hypothetical protein
MPPFVDTVIRWCIKHLPDETLQKFRNFVRDQFGIADDELDLFMKPLIQQRDRDRITQKRQEIEAQRKKGTTKT